MNLIHENGISGGLAKIEVSLTDIGSILAAYTVALPEMRKNVAILAGEGAVMDGAFASIERGEAIMGFLELLHDALETGGKLEQMDLDELQIEACRQFSDDDRLRQTDVAAEHLHDGDNN